MSERLSKKLREKARRDFYMMKKRHKHLTFKQFMKTVKRLYKQGAIQLT